MQPLRAVSLFSNCGAGDIGYRNAGFRFDVMAELDRSRLDVCLLNHPGANGVCGDIRTTWKEVIKKYKDIAGDERPSLLCACPPCQGMSSARSGKGKHDDAAAGSKDSRNLLVTVVAKVALELQPKIIVIENVPAFFSKKIHHPDDNKPVSAANYLIAALSKKYIAFPIITDLSDFGVPQSRKRAFLTFIRKDTPGLNDLLGYGCAPFPIPTHSKSGIAILDALKSFELPTLDSSHISRANAEEYGGFHSVPVWTEKTYSMVAAIPKASGRSAFQNDQCKQCGPVDVTDTSIFCPDCNTPLPRPMLIDKNGNTRLIKGFKSSYRRMHADRPASTITTASGHIGSDYTIHPIENRLLSPLECALIQTFPRDFKWGNALSTVGHTHVREMIGEAVPPRFTHAHGEIIMSILTGNWRSEPINILDSRCLKGKTILASAAKKDGREDPHKYLDFALKKNKAAQRKINDLQIKNTI